MKKQGTAYLLAVTIGFLSLLIGFFVGRNTGRSPIQITKLPEVTVESQQTQVEQKININTATVDELQKIPGIGPTFAQRIVDYRQENGPFQNVLDLTKVKGIGIVRLEQMREYITV